MCFLRVIKDVCVCFLRVIKDVCVCAFFVLSRMCVCAFFVLSRMGVCVCVMFRRNECWRGTSQVPCSQGRVCVCAFFRVLKDLCVCDIGAILAGEDRHAP